MKEIVLKKLKERGKEVAEDAIMDTVEVLFEVIEEAVKKSENTYDDLALAVIPLIKPMILEQIDKIDGKEG